MIKKVIDGQNKTKINTGAALKYFAELTDDMSQLPTT